MDLTLPRDQLFGIAWGHWTSTESEEAAVLERGERIRLGARSAVWRGREAVGGTKNDFLVADGTVGAILPRLLGWRPQGAALDQLITVANHPELGVRLTYLKVYRVADLNAFSWIGSDMMSVWHLPVDGYIADYAIAPSADGSRSQLWLIQSGPGDKAVLVGSPLP
jgi:hypothetical protein